LLWGVGNGNSFQDQIYDSSLQEDASLTKTNKQKKPKQLSIPHNWNLRLIIKCTAMHNKMQRYSKGPQKEKKTQHFGHRQKREGNRKKERHSSFSPQCVPKGLHHTTQQKQQL